MLGPASYAHHRIDPPAIRLAEFAPERIRNFSIIAHIDHGKSTLADRLLEHAGTLPLGVRHQQFLDRLQVEKERGITVKAQSASLFYRTEAATTYLLNLIDCPGHVDFNYEVSRSLAACEGALLLVDASQGIQAQTMANYFLGIEFDLKMIPVVTKCDLPTADIPRVTRELQTVMGIDPAECLVCSAKSNIGIADLFPEIIRRIPPPIFSPELTRAKAPLRALLFDSWYDDYRGVICLVRVVDGALRKGDRISLLSTRSKYEVLDCGILYPDPVPTGELHCGQVGYVICGMKTIREARVGDTMAAVASSSSSSSSSPATATATTTTATTTPLPGFRPSKPMVFAGIYPVSADDLEHVRVAIEKLTLNDASVTVQKESSVALGMGFRCGFLGLLHMDVFQQRLEQEYNAEIIVTSPTVPYKLEMEDGSLLDIENPSQFPQEQKLTQVSRYMEPMVDATIIAPSSGIGDILALCEAKRGVQKEFSFVSADRALLRYRMPLSEVIVDFFDKLKSLSSGYASLDYEEAGYQETDLVKLQILLNQEPVDALSCIIHKSRAEPYGRLLVSKLKTLIDRHLFDIAIQAAVGRKVIARETISAMRKNVTAKCYGGDISRKRKLLEKQKEGKKRMKSIGSVSLSQDAFLSLLS